ncbi:MAG TPA: nuclear transport factor 2 family protein [Ignavibacteria bacterium]|nr:nuclear transport factor 2 family protein [Ignavibacteria bacterium]HRF67045.1 nuclear transport factor 2 family protein [Ignavibacteria bacterium]HRJ04055.1 nuclear transport factor 2 family protein [Ignavibacteria bacterium]
MKSLLLIFGLVFLFATSSYSQDDLKAAGETMERGLFQTVKDKDWNTLEGLIAAGFQSMHADGPKSRSVAIDYIKSITFKYYHFSDIVVTNNDAGTNIVISYKLTFSENLEMTEEEKGKYVNNLSVWQKTGDKWQWISHSVFDGNVKK